MTEIILEKDSEVEEQLSTCDRCGARSFFLVIFDSGELQFCRHHFVENEDAIREMSYYVIDRSEDLLGS